MTYNCINPTTYASTASSVATASWSVGAKINGYSAFTIVDFTGASTDGFGVYVATEFKAVAVSATALIAHLDTVNINSGNVAEKYYMMYDASYTYQPVCGTGACPTYTVDCNPPFDWSPKSISFNLDTDATGATYDLPQVVDCLGRKMYYYDNALNWKLPGG